MATILRSFPSFGRKKYWPAVIIVLAGTALRLYQWYFSMPLWVDEQMVLLNVRDRSVSELTGPLWLNQTAPLGWLSLQRAVITAFGTADRAVRALPVLFGIGTLWTGLWMARRLMSPLAAAAFVMLCTAAQWTTYYAVEAKPYSADAFWALALTALAVWAADPVGDRPVSLARTAMWWCVAAIAQWFSFGAIFTTPGSAVVLCAIGWWRAGWRVAAAIALQGVIWLIPFAAHYALSIGYASNDQYLKAYWRFAFPPSGAGVTGTLRWLAKQVEPLAWNPGGAAFWAPFWLSAAVGVGLMLVRHPAAGLLVVAVPISTFTLAALRRLPLADRLALWMVPALYAAIAFALGHVIERGRASFSRREWGGVAFAATAAVMVGLVCVDIVHSGGQTFIAGGTNHGLDDRRALRFLMFNRQPGDVLLTTHLGLPAVWWYADVPISDGNAGRRHPQDGMPIFELTHMSAGARGCRGQSSRRQLSESLAGAQRAIVHLGFASNVPPGLQELVLDELSSLGTLTAYRRIGSEGVVAIFDFNLPPQSWMENVTRPTGRQLDYVERPGGCIGVQPAERW